MTNEIPLSDVEYKILREAMTNGAFSGFVQTNQGPRRGGCTAEVLETVRNLPLSEVRITLRAYVASKIKMANDKVNTITEQLEKAEQDLVDAQEIVIQS